MNLLPAPSEILEAYSSLRERVPSMMGSIVADSERVVLKLLESDLQVESVLATREWYEKHPEVQNRGVTLYETQKSALEKLIGFDLHQGVMARAARPQDQTLPDIASGPCIVLDGIAKADNVGAIIRNAAAFGFRNVLIGPDTCHPYNRRAIRVSMGNIFSMRIHQATDLTESIASLKKMGVSFYAFENRSFAKDLPDVRFPHLSAILIGSEGAGISQQILAMADNFVRIPIDSDVHALNAACASAVAMYAFTRQSGPALPK